MIFSNSRYKSLNTLVADSHICLNKGSISIKNDIGQLTQNDINQIADDYYYDTKAAYILPTDKNTIRELIPNFIKKRYAIGVIRDNTQIVGMIAAEQLLSELSGKTELYVRYYNTTLLGIKSANALIIAHRFLIEYSKNRDISHIVTMSITYDFKRIYNKILEKDGWLSQGYMSIYKLRR